MGLLTIRCTRSPLTPLDGSSPVIGFRLSMGARRDARWCGDEPSGPLCSGRAGWLVDEAVDRPVIAVDNPVR